MTAFLLFVAAHPSFADIGTLFQWTDKEGVVHVTDDLLNVPPEYKDQVKTFESTHVEEDFPDLPYRDTPSPPVGGGGAELYGGKPLGWWQWTLDKKREEVEKVSTMTTQWKQYITVYEKGRRFGQFFTEDEVESYERYKKDLPDQEARLKKIKEGFEELLRKAKVAGVPKKVRGE